MTAPPVRFVWDEGADETLGPPAYATDGAVGADVRANLPEPARADGVTLEPGARAVIPTGLRVAIPGGWEMQLRPRSGLALEHGVTLPNAPATIDADYRGPLGVILANWGAAPVTIHHGDRIAQAVLAPVARAGFSAVAALDATPRGAGGYGSTGRA